MYKIIIEEIKETIVEGQEYTRLHEQEDCKSGSDCEHWGYVDNKEKRTDKNVVLEQTADYETIDLAAIFNAFNQVK